MYWSTGRLTGKICRAMLGPALSACIGAPVPFGLLRLSMSICPLLLMSYHLALRGWL